LSPDFQPAGTAPRRRFGPVVASCIHAINCCRDCAASTLPTSTFSVESTIARGVVVSRGSPGMFAFNSASVRSSLVMGSPMWRRNCVSATGPPSGWRRIFAAALSLSVTAAAHRSRTLIEPSATSVEVIGA
jgi:hypothetical protein